MVNIEGVCILSSVASNGSLFPQNPAVLYRLLNGEMPDDFNPKIWWLELGMSDLGRSQCSEELVVLGILRVVEEIVNQKPDTNVVINSMFPMIELREKLDPNDMDTGLDESFGENSKKNNNNKNGNKGTRFEVCDTSTTTCLWQPKTTP
jgi:hypothetical protein